MALFRSNQENDEEMFETGEAEYDDGFDDVTEEEEPPLSEEELSERRKDRVRMAVGAGNLAGVIGGAVAILVLLSFLLHMIYFVINDLGRNFSLFQTRF